MKSQILELNDKFDYLVAMMIKSQHIPVSKVVSAEKVRGLSESDDRAAGRKSFDIDQIEDSE